MSDLCKKIPCKEKVDYYLAILGGFIFLDILLITYIFIINGAHSPNSENVMSNIYNTMILFLMKY